MDNIVSSAIPPESINIELHFVDAATSNATSDASTVKQYDINYDPPMTSSNEASVSVEQLLAVIQEQEEEQGNQQMEVPQTDSQAPGSLFEDDEDVPESLRRQYVCDKCGRVYRSRSGLDDHVSVVHEQSLHVCHICGATMKWKTNLKTHLRTVHNIGGPKRALVINRKCQECGATFRSNVLLYHHLRKVHKVAKPIKCKVCSKTFSTVGPSWWDHKKMHPEVYPCYTCDVCQSRFSTLGGFKKHQLQSGHGNNVKGQVDVTTGENIKINVKGQAYDVEGQSGIGENEKAVMEDGIKDYTASSGDNEQTLSCPKCGIEFTSYFGYRCHIMRNNCYTRKNGNGRRSGWKKESEDELLCCGKVYESPKEYRKHINVHEHDNETDSRRPKERKRFECPDCKKRVDISSLLYHQKKHSGVKNFACDQCDYRCIYAYDLKKHKLVHTDLKPYQCKFCSRKFRQNTDWQRHENVHVSLKNEGAKLECAKCFKKFGDKKNRNMHQKKCNGSSIGNYAALAKGSLGFLCNVCFGFFFNRSGLSVHQRQRVCHKEGTAEETDMNAQATMIKVAGESGEVLEVPLESLYICKVCSQVFEDASYHESHELWCIRNERRNGGYRRKRLMRVDVDNDTHDDGDDDDDDDDDTDYVDDQLIGEEYDKDGMQIMQVSKPSSKTKTIQPKQKGSMKRKKVKCSLVSSAITCCTCNRNTNEIIRQECAKHLIDSLNNQDRRHHLAKDHPDKDVQMENGSTELKCSTCQKTTEKLLLEHRCTPHFYCGDCREVFTCKAVLERHSEGHKKKQEQFCCSYCNSRFHSMSALRFHNRQVHDEVAYQMQETRSEDKVQETRNQGDLREELVIQEQGGRVTRKGLPSGKVVILLNSPKKKVSSIVKAGRSPRQQRRAPQMITLNRLPGKEPHTGDRFQSGGMEMKTHKMSNVLRENVSKMARHGKPAASRRKICWDTESDDGSAGSSMSDVPPCGTLLREIKFSENIEYVDDSLQQEPQEKVPRRAHSNQCPYCKQKFSIYSNLLVHLRTHGIKMPHHCNYCYMCYASHSQLVDHLTETHRDILDLLKVAMLGEPPVGFPTEDDVFIN